MRVYGFPAKLGAIRHKFLGLRGLAGIGLPSGLSQKPFQPRHTGRICGVSPPRRRAALVSDGRHRPFVLPPGRPSPAHTLCGAGAGRFSLLPESVGGHYRPDLCQLAALRIESRQIQSTFFGCGPVSRVSSESGDRRPGRQTRPVHLRISTLGHRAARLFRPTRFASWESFRLVRCTASKFAIRPCSVVTTATSFERITLPTSTITGRPCLRWAINIKYWIDALPPRSPSYDC